MSQPNLGLSGAQIEAAITILEKLLADESVLRVKLQKYHWNVVGSQFVALHTLFEDQYNALAPVVDDTAERIRQYGAMAPGTLHEFLELARLKEQPGVNPDAHGMTIELAEDHEALVRQLHADLATAQAQVHDIGLEDLLTETLQMHQKMAWFLRSQAA
ncbi:MAG: DNA starvation/stationary phase protection protein [Anaerolineae bacterium]|jgi:starvation-inducible DNA-binding protein|nr:DNA starvation/stationary phase protection protein [Anaerolineae bacterium]